MFITERGIPSYVLLTFEAYKRLAGKELSIAEALGQHDDDGDFEFDPPRMSDDWSLKIPDFED